MTERRYIAETEFRAEEGEGGALKIHGRAVPWMSLSVPLWRDFRTGKPVREQFARGAFAELLAKPGLDVVALRDHHPTRLLGRTAAGTLRVYESEGGLDYDFSPPDTTDGRDVVALVKRGDLRGSSFAFGVLADAVHEAWEETSDAIIRTVQKAALLADVSVVTSPAYQGSTVDARSLDQVKASLEAWRGGDQRAYHERMAELALLGL